MKYVLVKIYVLVDDSDLIFDSISCNANSDNVKIVEIMDLTPEEAMALNNQIIVYEKTKMINDENDFCCIYRLIPENEFLNFIPPKDFNIPENMGVICDFPNMMTVKSEKDKRFISIHIASMENIKTIISRISPFHNGMMNSIESNFHKFDGLYYHEAADKTIIHRHKIYFFNINLKEILSKIPYKQFEEEMIDSAYEVIHFYLSHLYLDDYHKMDYNKLDAYFTMKDINFSKKGEAIWNKYWQK